jgi:hypothetical protein
MGLLPEGQINVGWPGLGGGNVTVMISTGEALAIVNVPPCASANGMNANELHHGLKDSSQSRPTISSGADATAMVLESPHVDEFADEIGPAKGATGEMIRQCLRGNPAQKWAYQ